jgi:hypothetical protein
MRIVLGLSCSILLFSFLIVKIIKKKDKMDRAVFEKFCCIVCLVNFSKVLFITIVAIQKNVSSIIIDLFLIAKDL